MFYYLISFDCETTGLSTERDQIVEFGAAIQSWDSLNGTLVDLESFTLHAKPAMAKMSKKAEEITGISMNMLHDKPNIIIVLDKFLQHVERICSDLLIPRIFVSYNGFQYDIPLMVMELERHKRSAIAYFRQLKLHCTVDLLPLARSCVDSTCLKRKANGSCSYKLGDVYRSVCSKPLINAHGALVDSQAVLTLLSFPCFQNALRDLLKDGSDHVLDTPHCKNPMGLVRNVIGRKDKKLFSKTRRVVDMMVNYQKKRKIILPVEDISHSPKKNKGILNLSL
jgi:DNA polymerase III alpha subunit (gram-positive type)